MAINDRLALVSVSPGPRLIRRWLVRSGGWGRRRGKGRGKNWRSVETPVMRRRSSEIRPVDRAPATGPSSASGYERNAGELDLVAVLLEVDADGGREGGREETPIHRGEQGLRGRRILSFEEDAPRPDPGGRAERGPHAVSGGTRPGPGGRAQVIEAAGHLSVLQEEDPAAWDSFAVERGVAGRIVGDRESRRGDASPAQPSGGTVGREERGEGGEHRRADARIQEPLPVRDRRGPVRQRQRGGVGQAAGERLDAGGVAPAESQPRPRGRGRRWRPTACATPSNARWRCPTSRPAPLTMRSRASPFRRLSAARRAWPRAAAETARASSSKRSGGAATGSSSGHL